MDALLFILLNGFIASFYIGTWSMFAGIKKLLRHTGPTTGMTLILIGAGLFALSWFCFKYWYSQVA